MTGAECAGRNATHMVEELRRARAPRELQRMLPTGLPRTVSSASRQALPQIVVEHANRRIADHVLGSRHRKGGNGHAARQRFELDDAEGVGPARKHEHVGSGHVRGQVLPAQRAEELRRRETARAAPLPAAHGRSRPWCPAGRATRNASRFFSGAMRPTHMKIGRGKSRSIARSGWNSSVSTPRLHILSRVKPACRKLGHQRLCRHHRDGRRLVKTAQRRVAPGHGKRRARGDVLGKARREAGRERHAVGNAIAPHHEADRALGGDVDGIRRRLARCGPRCRRASAARSAGPGRSAGERTQSPPASGSRSVDPAAQRLRASDCRVRTTPLICGCQASVAIRTRIVRQPPVCWRTRHAELGYSRGAPSPLRISVV